jgi:adenylate kinase
MVVELRSENTDDIDANVERIESWIKQWRKDNGKEGGGEAKAATEEKKDEDDPMFLHG